MLPIGSRPSSHAQALSIVCGVVLVVIGCDRAGAGTASGATHEMKSAPATDMITLDLGACDASVRYSSRRFFVATDGTGTDNSTGETVRTVELAENSQEVRDIFAGRGPATEYPATVSWLIYPRAAGAGDLALWIKKRFYSGEATAQVTSGKVGSREVLLDHFSGEESEVDAVTFACDDKIVRAVVAYPRGGDNAVHRGFAEILATLTGRVDET